MRHFLSGKLIAFDTETTGLDLWHRDAPFAFSFCNLDGETAYFEWKVDPFTRAITPVEDELEMMRALLEDPAIAIVGHNLKFDMRAVRNHLGIEMAGELHDTGISTRMGLDRRKFGLKPICEDVLGYPVEDESELQKAVVKARAYGKKQGWNIGSEVKCDYWLPKAVDPKNRLCEKYAVGDVMRTILLHQYMQKLLQGRKVLSPALKEDGEPHPTKLYHLEPTNYNPSWKPFIPRLKTATVWEEYLFEMEVFPITFEMENRGIRINPKRVLEEIDATRKHVKKITKQLHDRFGDDFNAKSSQKVGAAIFSPESEGGLGCEAYVFTKKGLPSTAKAVLKAYAGIKEVQWIIDFKPIAKAESTYYRPYMRHRVPELALLAGRGIKIWTIHPNLNQYGARTSRFSCTDPNLQNIPKPPKEGEVASYLTRARAPFCARPGHVNLHMDYSQIEARLFAEESGDEMMLTAFRLGRDVYQEMADKINRSAFKGKSAMMKGKRGRDIAKAIFLGILYGEGKKKLRIQLGVAMSDADDIIKAFEITFPKVRDYQRRTIREVHKTGYVVTRYGQKIPVPLDEAYKGINYRIQGSAARLLKAAMVRIRNWIKKNFPESMAMILCIHDELIIEMKASVFNKTNVDQLQRLMEENDGMWRLVKTSAEVECVTASWLDKADLPWKVAA